MFPRGLGSFEVNLKCSWRPQRLTVRASNKGGPESGDKNKNEGTDLFVRFLFSVP